MKKLKSKRGLSLMETTVSILILVMLVVAMGTGINTSTRVYKDSVFESDSASLADILNNSLTDVLRSAQNIYVADEKTVFTNIDYGYQNVHFILSSGEKSVLNVKYESLDNEGAPLVNEGVYSKMELLDFEITYVAAGSSNEITRTDNTVITPSEGGLFYIKYTIVHESDADLTRNVETVIRLMNAG